MSARHMCDESTDSAVSFRFVILAQLACLSPLQVNFTDTRSPVKPDGRELLPTQSLLYRFLEGFAGTKLISTRLKL